MVRIGINGFGRTGRTAARIALVDARTELAAINSRADASSHAYLLKHDSIYGKLDLAVKVERHGEGRTSLRVGEKEVAVYQEESPEKIPWEKSQVDVVLECTGKFRTRETAGAHLRPGVARVIISAPPKDDDVPTFVLGVNEKKFRPEMTVISNASCTTNCLAVVCKVLDEHFTIKRGFMTTIHSPTDSQNLLDNSNKKVRLRRCSPLSIIPSTTGASKSLGLVLPQLAGKVGCQSLRVIPFSGSLIDLAVEVEKATSVEEINQRFKEASRGELKGLLEVAEDEIVGVDVQKTPYSATVDPYLTDVVNDNLVKVFAWYDNEWGYSRRLVDLAIYAASKK